MFENKCKKCGSVSLHLEIKGVNTGLYCNKCGSWQKWLSKDEIRVFNYNDTISKMRETTPEENKAISEYIQKNSKPLGINLFDILDGKTIVDRLNEFIEYLNKEINSEMDKLPISQEDAIRKSAYCQGLQKVTYSLQNIIDGKEFNE